jgi:hypothetical protein
MLFFFPSPKACEDIIVSHSQTNWLKTKYGERSEFLLSIAVRDQLVQHLVCTSKVHYNIHRNTLLTPVLQSELSDRL